MYLLKRKDKVFTHVGLYVDDHTILHYGSKTNNMFAGDHEVQISSLAAFANGRKVTRKRIEENVELGTLYVRVEKIKSNKKKYNIFANNCISFILMCLYGREEISFAEMIKGMLKYRIEPLALLLH